MRALLLLLTLLVALPAAAQDPLPPDVRDQVPRTEFEEEGLDQLRRDANGQLAVWSGLSLGFGLGASAAHAMTGLRKPLAPQLGFSLAGVASFHLIQLATVGGVRFSMEAEDSAKRMRRAARGASWIFGVAGGVSAVAVGFAAATFLGWEDPTWAFAAANIPLGLITASITTGVWAERFQSVHRGRGGRLRARVYPGPTSLTVVW